MFWNTLYLGRRGCYSISASHIFTNSSPPSPITTKFDHITDHLRIPNNKSIPSNPRYQNSPDEARCSQQVTSLRDIGGTCCYINMNAEELYEMSISNALRNSTIQLGDKIFYSRSEQQQRLCKKYQLF